MTTPVRERFERLFEGKPKPERPGPDTTKLHDHTNRHTTSSDAHTFGEKPQVNIAKQKSKPRAVPSAGAHGYPADIQREPLIPLQYLPYGKDNLDIHPAKGSNHEDVSEDESLLAEDTFGNVCTGHFCVFQLVAKFPYKYMVDGNDRVSRHFFASNKFYDRKWDL